MQIGSWLRIESSKGLRKSWLAEDFLSEIPINLARDTSQHTVLSSLQGIAPLLMPVRHHGGAASNQ